MDKFPGDRDKFPVAKCPDQYLGLVDGECIKVDDHYMLKLGDTLVSLYGFLQWPGLYSFLDKYGDGGGIEYNHIFSGGVYIREMRAPAGVIVIGKRHRYETCNILMSGTMSVWVSGESGSGEERVQEISGPIIITSKPGARKIAYCHTDVVFHNIHPTDLTDLDEIEKEFVIPEEGFHLLQNREEMLCLGEQ